ncbi:MAG: PqqD family peptide modification chaperone [Candidatus Hatepunaea meridiana]|nr:PqqD family peptide modification chaperone [Candidatus Hatepunaea meridiana]
MSSKNVIANPTVVFREDLDDIAVIFDPDSGKAFSLNHTGVLIWKSLDGKRSEKDILEKLETDYNNLPENVEDHLNKFINTMITNGLVGYVA